VATSRGIDVSAYQNPQDWAGHKADGVVFAFAKASEGQHTHDDMFAKHIVGIVRAGLVPGAYHFGWPTQDPTVEAANYVAAVAPYVTTGFLHWLDLERRTDGANYAGRTAAQIKAWATTWITAVQAAFPGQRVGVYTSSDDLSKDHVPAGVPLWYPAYTWGYTAAPYSKAETASWPHPSGWSPRFWQFTSTPLDRSICNLSPADLQAWANQEDTMAALTAQETHDAVWKIDDITAPTSETATNPTWQPQSYLKDTNGRVRGLETAVASVVSSQAAQSIVLTEIAAKVDALQPAVLSDAQVQAIASSPVLAAAIAEQVAVKLAARLAS
jgi:GH25 family lysozyme M1 (1,4-beta-N-acetylmuramidase)